MNRNNDFLISILAVIGFLLISGAAFAGPMNCSGEHKACVLTCIKSTAINVSVAACVNACNTRQSSCTHTGCWNNGTLNYCGLQRK